MGLVFHSSLPPKLVQLALLSGGDSACKQTNVVHPASWTMARTRSVADPRPDPGCRPCMMSPGTSQLEVAEK
jgi:hypothetical protein